MKNISINRVSIASLSLLFCANTVLADIPRQSLNGELKEPGLSGYLQILAGGYRNEGPVSIGDGHELINSLNAGSESSDEGFVIPLWKLNYLIPRTSTSLYAGTPDYSVFHDTAVFEVGIGHQLEDGTFMSVSYTPDISGFRHEVWQDPYLTGQKRKRTDFSIEALHLSIENIFDTGISFNHSFGKQFIDDDRAGKSLSSRLTPSELNQLKREGKFHNSNLTLTIPLANYFYLIPGVSYTRLDAEGEASSHDSLGTGLTFVFQQGQFELFVDGYFQRADYEKPNPVFNVKRKDDRYGFRTGVSYLEPFGWDGIKLDLIAGDSRQDSNIRFFDTTEEFLAVGMTYEY